MKNSGFFTKKVGIFFLLFGILIGLVLILTGCLIPNTTNKKIEEVHNGYLFNNNYFDMNRQNSNYYDYNRNFLDKYTNPFNLTNSQRFYLFGIFVISFTVFISVSIFIGAKRREKIIYKLLLK